MNISKIAIENRQFVLIIIIIAVIVSAQSFVKMPRAEDPNLSVPYFFIRIAHPGTSPEDMEHLIVDPLEEVLNEIDDVTEIRSRIREGIANITITASFSVDPKEKFDEIIRETSRVREKLPDDLILFEVNHFNPVDQTAIYQYGLVSETSSYTELLKYGEAFKAALKKAEGIKKVDIEAYPKEELRISLDYKRMSALNISLQQVVNTLTSNNKNIPGGAINAQNKTLSIKTTGGYKTIKEIEKTVLTTASGKVIYLKDIAKVEVDHEDLLWISRYKQKNALWVTIKMEEGVNILQLESKIREVETAFKETLPEKIALVTAFEQASAVKKKINDFFINLLQGMVLVGAIIFLFIGWRAAIIIITIIPLSILIGLAILSGSGFALQQVSIAALILALGLLVDNGIVVIESIDYYLEQGLSLKEAAIEGTRKVSHAIISSTITTILSFFPLSQLGAGGGEFVKSLPITVILTLLISLILALTLSPILSSKIMSKKKAGQPGFVKRCMDWVGNKIYGPFLYFCLRKGWLVLSLSILFLIFSISLFPKIGVSLLPPTDKPLLLIDVETPKGTNIEGTDEVVRFVEQVLDTMAYVKNYAANTGHGNPQIFYNRAPSSYEKNKGQVLVNFSHWDPDQFYNALGRLRTIFYDYPSAKITISELKNGPPNTPIEFLIVGENIDTLRKVAFQVEEILKTTEGVINVNNPLRINETGLEVALNKTKAGLINLSYLDFDQTIRACLSGLPIGEVSIEEGKDYPMVVHLTFNKNPSIADINKIYLRTISGSQVPLRQVADIHFKSLSPEILHLNLDRYARIKGDVTNSDRTIAITQVINDKLANFSLPPGYSIVPKGEFANQQEIFGDLSVIFMLVLLSVFAVLVLQFRSILQPIVIFSAIPLAVSGSFVMLYLTGWPFSFLAFVGFISVSGIVVNDSILIVDQINQLRKQGMPRLEAIKTGSERRLVPVILTSLTTILGLIPLAISQSNLWSPICATIIGGMLSSTFMILFVVPILYKWLTNFD